MQKHKLTWLAALLNFVAPGAGYVYVGTRLRFGVLLLAAITIMLFSPPIEGATEPTMAEIEAMLQDPGFLVMMLAGFLIAAAFAYDAWGDARSYNESLPSLQASDEDEV